MRDDRVSTTNTGKARSLAKASEFNCASAGSRNFVNGVRQVFVADVAVVGSIEQNKCTRFVCVIHKLLQGLAAQNRTRRVVRFRNRLILFPLLLLLLRLFGIGTDRSAYIEPEDLSVHTDDAVKIQDRKNDPKQRERAGAYQGKNIPG